MCEVVRAGVTSPPQGDPKEQAIRKRLERLGRELVIYCRPLHELDLKYRDFKYEVNRFLKPRVRPELPREARAPSLYYLYGYLTFGDLWEYKYLVSHTLDKSFVRVANDIDEDTARFKLYSAREAITTCRKTMQMEVREWGRLGEFIEMLASEGYEGFGRILRMPVGSFIVSFPIPSSIQEAPRVYYHRLRDLMIEYVTHTPPLADFFKRHISMLLKAKLNYTDEEIEKTLSCVKWCW